MALMPKRVKYRKQQRGTMKGNATRRNYVAFGEYGLQALEPHWITGRQIEAGRIAATHLSETRRKSVYPHLPESFLYSQAAWKPEWVKARPKSKAGWQW